MSPTADAERVAEHLAAAYAQGMDQGRLAMEALYADTVDNRHTPPSPGDGPADATFLRARSKAEAAAGRRALSNSVAEEVSVTAEGERVRVRTASRGTLPDGEVVRVKTNMVIELQDGRIVGKNSYFDPDTMSQLVKVLRTGGFEFSSEVTARLDGR